MENAAIFGKLPAVQFLKLKGADCNGATRSMHQNIRNFLRLSDDQLRASPAAAVGALVFTSHVV